MNGPETSEFSFNRRAILKAGSATMTGMAAAGVAKAAPPPIRLIAVEEAWACPEWMDAMASVAAQGLEEDEVRAFRMLAHIGDIHAYVRDRLSLRAYRRGGFVHPLRPVPG